MRRPEEALQIAIAGMLRVSVDEKDCRWTHIPHGGKRSKATAGRLKAMGVNAGWPDFVFVKADGTTFFVELKAPRGALSFAQRELRAFLDTARVPFEVVTSVEGMIETLKRHGVPCRVAAYV